MNDMRDEFEAYVKKLTTAICKDIFLEKLEELYNKYEEEYNLYSKASHHAETVSKSLEQELKNTVLFLKDVDEKTSKSMDFINDNIGQMEEFTEQMFLKMWNLNEEKRIEFISALSSHIDGYKKELAKIFKDGNKNISNKLAGVITPEILQQFLDSLEENTRETKELASFISDTYKQEVEKSIKQIVEANRKAMEETNISVSEYMKQIMDELGETQKNAVASIEEQKNAVANTTSRYTSLLIQCFNKFAQTEKENREKALEEQKKLIAAIGPSDEKIAQFESRVIKLERLIKEMEKTNETYYQKIQQAFEQYVKEQRSLQIQQYENMALLQRRTEELSHRAAKTTDTTMILLCIIFGLEIGNVFGGIGLLVTAGVIISAVMFHPKWKMKVISFIKTKLLPGK